MTTSLDEMLSDAITHHKNGDLIIAEEIYQKILMINPELSDANHNLGMLKFQNKQLSEALVYLQKALLGDSFTSQYWVSYITTLIAANQHGFARDVLILGAQYGLDQNTVLQLERQLAPAVTPVSVWNTSETVQKSAEVEETLLAGFPKMKGGNQPSWGEKETLRELMTTGQKGEIEGYLRMLCDKYPYFTEGWKILGIFLVEHHNYQEALQIFANNVETSFESDARVKNAVGICLMQLGEPTKAIDKFNKAIEIDQNFVDAINNLGNAQKNLGLLLEAINTYSKAISINPSLAHLYFNLGVAYQEAGDLESAITNYLRAIDLSPDFPDTYFNLGCAWKGLLEYDKSAASFAKATELNPSYYDAYLNLGLLQQERGDHLAAELSYRKASSINSENTDAYNLLGTSLHRQGRLEEAVDIFQQVIHTQPQNAGYYNNLGLVLHELGKTQEVISAYQKSIEINSDYAPAHNNYGLVLHELGRYDEALDAIRKAIVLAPELAEPYCNLANVYRDIGQFELAIDSFNKALAIKPDYRDAYDALLFCLNYHPEMPAESIYQYYKKYEAVFGKHPHEKINNQFTNNKLRHRRLKVGYVASSFHKHSCRHFLFPLIEHHNRSEFELFAYAHLLKEDPITEKYKTHFDHWVPCRGWCDEALFKKIQNDGIDILVDVSGHTIGNRLGVFAMRPSPVSLHWLDFGYTTGLKSIDYYLTDSETAPIGSQSLFSEEIWRLDGPAFAYRPDAEMGDVGALPALENGYVTYGTFTRSVRINNKVLRVWAEILSHVPNSKLIVNSSSYNNDYLKRNLLNQFHQMGISSDRILVGSISPPWGILRQTDIGLDCFPHNSGTTLLETLYMGIPFITLRDRPPVGRIGSSILRALNHQEWIADTEESYVDKAVSLATDLGKLSDIRRTMRSKLEASPLMDEIGFARNVEKAYREMWMNWCSRNV